MTYTDADKTRLLAFAGVTPGLEDALMADLRRVAPELGAQRVVGGAEFRCGRATLLGLVRDLRVAELLRVRVARFDARTFAELEHHAARIQWHAWLARDAEVEVRVRCTKSRLWHSDAVGERVARGLIASGRRVAGLTAATLDAADAGAVEGTDGAVQTVHVRIDHDHVAVSLDAAGDRLHRRGQRVAVGEAPLRETVAAALALHTGAAAAPVLCDPFCGSGVFLLEAHALALGTPARDPACAANAWVCMRGIDPAPHRTVPLGASRGCPRLIGGDIDPRVLAAAQQNLLRAGVADATWTCGDAADTLRAHPDAAVLCNPPWGNRIGLQAGVLRRVGAALRERSGPSYLLSADGQLSAGLKVPLARRLTFDYRGTRVSLNEVCR